jgi:single-strand DNA-binding protein
MNTINLSGHLTEDPKLVHRSERPICEMRLAVDNGAHMTTFIDVRAFDEQAYACAEYLRKGRKIGVSGKLIYDEWRAADGSRRNRYSVIGRVEFLDRPPEDLVKPPNDSDSRGGPEADSEQPQLLAA